MNFLRIFELFLQTHANNVASNKQVNNNITRTRETSLAQCHSQINDNNSNKPETECNVPINSNEDSFIHSLANIAPIEIRPNDNTYKGPKENEIGLNVGPEDNGILNKATEASSVVDIIEDEPDINQSNNDLTQTQVTYKAMVSNDATYNTEAETFKINDNNLNKLETECNIPISNKKDYRNIDSSVICIDEFGVTKIFHNLANVAPIKIRANDNTYNEPKENEIGLNVGPEDNGILNNVTEASSVVNDTEDESDINKSNNGPTQIQVTYKAMVSNDATYNTKADPFNNAIYIDDGTIENLKEFEEALNNIDKTAVTHDFGAELINLDDFNEIFDELDDENEDLDFVNGPVKSVFTNNKIATNCIEKTNPNEHETNSNTNENIDIISINSSTEKEKSQTEEIRDTITIQAVFRESDSDDGYNSSDFEFISETEANMAGFVIKYGLEDYQNPSPASSESEPLIRFSTQYFSGKDEKKASDPGEGPSRQNRPRNEFEDRSYRNRHHIPLGNDYLGLFQGIYNPQLPMSEIYFLENKAIRVSAMNHQYDGIGFDRQLALRRHQPDSSEDEFEDEAKESAKKILNMYPGENRKRKRRY